MSRRPDSGQDQIDDYAAAYNEDTFEDEVAESADISEEDAMKMFLGGDVDELVEEEKENTKPFEATKVATDDLYRRSCRHCREEFDTRSADGSHRCPGRIEFEQKLRDEGTTVYQTTAPHESYACLYYDGENATVGSSRFGGFCAIRGQMLVCLDAEAPSVHLPDNVTVMYHDGEPDDELAAGRTARIKRWD